MEWSRDWLKTVSFPFLLVLQLSKFSYPSWLLPLSRFLSLFLLFLPFSISLPPSITHVTYLLWAPDGDEGVERTLRHRRNPIVPRQYRRRRPLRSPQCSPTTPIYRAMSTCKGHQHPVETIECFTLEEDEPQLTMIHTCCQALSPLD